MAWVAIWNDGIPMLDRNRIAADHPEEALSLVLECEMPPCAPRPQRIWRGTPQAGHPLEIELTPQGALQVLHGEIAVATPDGFAAENDIVTLRYVCCARGRHDVIDILNRNTKERVRLRTALPMRCRPSDLWPVDSSYLALINVAALTTHVLQSTDLPGIGAGTLVLTDAGPMPVETLTTGHRVIGRDGAAYPLRWIAARDRLCLGQIAPVMIRAPYLGLETDLCVTPETRILRNGAEVEYMTGTNEVFVKAADLVPGMAARFDRSKPVRTFYHLMLDDPDCLRVGRCELETADLEEVLAASDGHVGLQRDIPLRPEPSRPLLNRMATRSLMDMGLSGAGAMA